MKNRIGILRKTELKMTQTQLAQELSVSLRTVQMWEDETTPPVDQLINLQRVLHAHGIEASLDYILALSDYRTPERADIGAVTGLSDSAVLTLQKLSPDDRNTLSYILSEKESASMLLSDIREFIKPTCLLPAHLTEKPGTELTIEPQSGQPFFVLTNEAKTDQRTVYINAAFIDTVMLNQIAKALKAYRKPSETTA